MYSVAFVYSVLTVRATFVFISIMKSMMISSSVFATSLNFSSLSFSTPQELQKHGGPDMIVALVGNKADLHENRSVSSQV
jgi:hypothetical protein